LTKKNFALALIFTHDGLKPDLLMRVCRAVFAAATVHVAVVPVDAAVPDGAPEVVLPPPLLVQAAVRLPAISAAATVRDTVMRPPNVEH
jgi:hypothetical protein